MNCMNCSKPVKVTQDLRVMVGKEVVAAVCAQCLKCKGMIRLTLERTTEEEPFRAYQYSCLKPILNEDHSDDAIF